MLNARIKASQTIASPEQLRKEVPATPRAQNTIEKARRVIENIKTGEDKRLLVLIGPCSIHDEKGADEYAKNLLEIIPKIQETMFVVMRFYVDKPRSGNGWKGLANDPHMDDSCDIEEGIRMARRMIIRYAECGLAVVIEFVDPLLPKYLADITGMATIGARTSSSQPHQVIASGLSMPVGIKHDTFGNLDTAINAIKKAQTSHTFPTVNDKGEYCKYVTVGNPFGIMILRGGSRPNYDSVNIGQAQDKLRKAGLGPELIVDCSHGNSGKKHNRQVLVWENVIQQRTNGNCSIIGLMFEGNIFEGNQPSGDLASLKYGTSFTDECSSWETTQKLLLWAHYELENKSVSCAV